MIDIDGLIRASMYDVKDGVVGSKVSLETYKLLKAKILEFKTAKNAREYNDSEEIALIRKMVSDRLNSAAIYSDNGRKDLADEEYAQADILQKLLPTIPTEEDIEGYVMANYPQGIEKRSMGLAIKDVKEKLLGADGKMVADVVKKHLA